MQKGDKVLIEGRDGWDRYTSMTVEVQNVASKSFIAAGMRFPLTGGYAQGVKSGKFSAAEPLWRYRA